MKKNLIMVVLGLTIGVIVLSSVLVPVIDSARSTAGETVVYNNSVTGYPLTLTEESHITISNVGSDITYNINGVDTYSRSWTINTYLFTTDVITFEFPVYSSTNIVNVRVADSNTFLQTNVNHTITVDYVGNVLTLVIDGGLPTTYDCSWAFVADKDGSYLQAARGVSDPFYVNDPNELYLSGRYVDKNTFYSLYDGDLEIIGAGATSDITYDIELVSGTTDIYAITDILVTIDDSAFNPYTVIVPISVSGHKSAGATYSIYGVIPVLMLVALMVYAVSVIRNRD